MKKKLIKLFQDDYIKVAFGFFIVGVFLRFYKLGDYVTFLGDQGRDVIVLRRILTFEHFPAIGAPTSVGQVYLGPFYYYFIAPWLALFNFHPLGPAVGVAVISSLFIILSYFVIADLFGKKTGLLFVSLITFSLALVDLSRYSWNPNLLPVFTLLFYVSLIYSTQRNQLKMFILSGALLSFCIQLHYIALVLALPTTVVVSRYFWNNRARLTVPLRNILVMAGSTFFFSLPLLIFDLRHDFLNSRNFIKLFTESEAVGGSRLSSVIDTFAALNKFAFNFELTSQLSMIFLLALAILSFMTVLRNRNNWIVPAFFFMNLIGVAMYSGPKYIHYFTVLYSFYYLLLAYLASKLFAKKIAWVGAMLLLVLYIYVSVPTMRFFFDLPSRQISHARQIATIIKENKTTSNFQVTGLPDKYSDSTYRYFLEIWGQRAAEHDSLQKADELFVVCEGGCKPIGDPMWDIAFFAPNKIVGEWKVGRDKIYKLVR